MQPREVGLRGETRAPRLRVLVDGDDLPGVVSAEVASNNHLAADRFRVQVAAGAGGLDAADAAAVRFDVQVGLDGSWTSLLVGEADSISVDPLRGVIDIEGRDLSALLIDTRLDETFANQTASEIVSTLAGRHGLQVAATGTDTLVGRYYQSEHDQTTTGTFSKVLSEWDLLAFLAGREGYDLFMEGDVLRFAPQGGGGLVVIEPSDCLSLSLEHALGMARAIEVTVRSWDQRGAQAVVQAARGGGKGRPWRHAVVRPNLPPDEAQRLAERVLADLVRHERTVSLSMPGELDLTPRSSVALRGTATEWDRTYAVSEVCRQVDVHCGFMQRVCLQGAA